MQKPGVVVVVTEEAEVRARLSELLESEGWVVLPLEDGCELFDFVEFISDNPGRRSAPRLIIADAQVPGPSVFETAAWARLNGLEVPFIVFSPADDEAARDVARAIGAIEITSEEDAPELVAETLAA
jgi:DNA-binding response OmpR family regulator